MSSEESVQIPRPLQPWEKVAAWIFGTLFVIGLGTITVLFIYQTGVKPVQPNQALEDYLGDRTFEKPLSIIVFRFTQKDYAPVIFSKFLPHSEMHDHNKTFYLGPLSNAFLAMAVWILIDRDEVKVEEELTKLFQEHPVEFKGKSLEMLLSQRIDWGNGDEDGRGVYQERNFVYLDQLIKEVTGDSSEAFIKKEILEPLEMTNTFFVDAETPSYQKGWHSNVVDLENFLKALNTNKVIGLPTYLKAFTAAKIGDDYARYGYGWRVIAYRGLRMEYFRGKSANTDHLLMRFPERGFSFIFLSHPNNPLDAVDFAKKAADAYLVREFPRFGVKPDASEFEK